MEIRVGEVNFRFNPRQVFFNQILSVIDLDKMLQHKILKEVKVEKMRRVGIKTDLNSHRYFFYWATSIINDDIINVN